MFNGKRLDRNCDFRLSKHKSFCAQVDYTREELFTFIMRWTRRTDHAGFLFEFGILGIYVEFEIYDHRHWDYEKNCWEIYD